MTNTIPQALSLAADSTADMIETYKYLHANPELSMQEHRTADYLTGRLEALGLEVFRCGGTGVVGVLRNGQGPVVGFRADTDGLPVLEDTGVDYASTATGFLEDGTEVPTMHACGHDTHMASALATAALYAGAKDDWAGTIVFVLQPGEETAAGARAMVQDGLWDKAPKPEIMYGQHVMPGLAGTVSLMAGAAMSTADSFKVTVHGQGSHGSMPEHSIDPIVLGAAMVLRLQTIVSRQVAPQSAAVVTIGSFHAGLKENVIPDRAVFTLNVRTFEPAVRETVLSSIRRIIAAEAAASGAPEPTIEDISNFPPLHNDPVQTALLEEQFRDEFGAEKVLQGTPVMGSEDFGALADAIGVPSVYWFFGGFDAQTVGSEHPPANHSPFFAPVIDPTLATAVAAAVRALYSKVGK
ncbi:amidohydrolase [Paeniglutamicibacter psychrophenolicus]|uniref:Hippurate hydrolase n=1 Tax=Paeniglutamicibacter psychrophenolicus TaxID=257454 RepID=A0ABS4WA20_9MICC|nr:amidohydrolase [Paeniglutamicibacter psychrophenolicus]MBP2373057.1 hippurate hydrolase [Paeniglutamicibacter psychrophenolicus]